MGTDMAEIRIKGHTINTDDILRIGDFIRREKLTYLQVHMRGGVIVELPAARHSYNPSDEEKAARGRKNEAFKEQVNGLWQRG